MHEDEFGALPDPQRTAILRMQFEAQRRGYAADFPGAEDYILLFDGEPAGRLLCAETVSEVRIVDIAVKAPLRNRGLGTCAIRLIGGRARERSKLLRLSVRRDNESALRWYRRLGFAAVAEDALYIGMEYDPSLVNEGRSPEPATAVYAKCVGRPACDAKMKFQWIFSPV